MEKPWRIELFGRLCARYGEKVVTRFRTQKTGALLAYLAYYPERLHTRESLIEMFWPEDGLAAGRNSLRVAVSSLRRALETPEIPGDSVFLADRTHLQLNGALMETDARLFETALHDASGAGDVSAQAALLTAAVELYRDELLVGSDEAWVEPERQRLADAYLGALRRLIRCLAQTRDYDRAIDYSRRAIHADPLREEFHRNLMRLYIALGRPAAALQQFHELERLLREEIGVAPAAATRELAQELLADRERAVIVERAAPPPAAHSLPSAAPPASPAASAPPQTGQPPLPLTRFFGREEELTLLERMLSPDTPAYRAAPAVHEVLQESEEEASGERLPAYDLAFSPVYDPEGPRPRLVTLLGSGGCGKTRLSVEVARRLRGAYEGAAWWVSLADVTDPRLIPEVIAGALGLERTGEADLFVGMNGKLSGQPSLLILDNFEQVAEEGALVVHRLLESAPSLVCLVTSRQRLEIAGEQVFPVTPLPSPIKPGTPERLMEFASVQLFADRARAARPDFQITKAHAAAVAALCHRLEGVPLAIELAAAWAQSLAPAQILTRLTKPLDLLVSRRQDIPARHRTLRAAIAGSYELLAPELQRLFARLSVFRGGWSLEAAEAVCADTQPPTPDARLLTPEEVLDALNQLRARSLILTEEAGEEMRYRMLETLRDYAAEQFAPEERQSLARRHARFFLNLAQEADANLKGAEQAEWLARMDREHENFRAALAWSLSDAGDPETALRLASVLWHYWLVRGHAREGRDWLASAVRSAKQAAPEILAAALHGAGNLAFIQGDYPAARRLYEECLALRRGLEDAQGVAATLGNLGNVAHHQGQFDEARGLYEESLALCRALDDLHGTANALQNLGNIVADQSDYPAARDYYTESLTLFREMEDPQGIANLLSNLGTVLREHGDSAGAYSLFEESMILNRELGSRQNLAVNLVNLGFVALDRRDSPAALGYLEESLSLFREMEDRLGMAYALEGFALLALAQNQPRRATLLLGAVEKLREALGAPFSPAELPRFEQSREAARAHSEPAVFQALWTRGRAMTLEQSVSFALQSLQSAPLR